MPTYEYVCESCEHGFELFQQMSEPVKRKCPECGKLKLRRLIGTGSGVLFKGSGFYQTDYRSESYRKASEAEKPKSDTDKTKKDSKKDTSSGADSSSAGASGKAASCGPACACAARH